MFFGHRHRFTASRGSFSTLTIGPCQYLSIEHHVTILPCLNITEQWLTSPSSPLSLPDLPEDKHDSHDYQESDEYSGESASSGQLIFLGDVGDELGLLMGNVAISPEPCELSERSRVCLGTKPGRN